MKGVFKNQSVGVYIINKILNDAIIEEHNETNSTPDVLKAMQLTKTVENHQMQVQLNGVNNSFQQMHNECQSCSKLFQHGNKIAYNDKAPCSTIDEFEEFKPEDIFSDLILSNEVPTQCNPEAIDAITQTSQSVLPCLLEAGVQTSQSFLDELETHSKKSSQKYFLSNLDKEQVVPEVEVQNIPPLTSPYKFRRIGLSKRARLNPLHVLNFK